MYTLDASLHISALNPTEADSELSRAFLVHVQRQQLPLLCPTLMLVEVAAAVVRALGDAERATALALTLRGWPSQTLIPLDGPLMERAIHLAAVARLRGADAVYAAVAQRYDTTLVTLDRQQLERLPSLLRTARPDAILRDLAL